MIMTAGTLALILSSDETTIKAGFIALVDVDIDALLASDPRLADLAGILVRSPITYWLDWISRHPEFDWKTVFADRLTIEFTTNRFRKFTVVA